jgi:NAD(P)-dependent dehydrogenase (short-subunit alcohol dehydrogenase family)
MSSPKTWLITGCSTGLGRHLAEFAAKQGDWVYATVRDESQTEALEELVPGKIKALVLDVTDADAVESQVAELIANTGKIDVLVNNAGYGSLGPIEFIHDEEVVRQFDVNVFGLLRMIRAVLPSMRHHRSGHIINISSVAGIYASPGMGVYNGSKYAVEGIGHALALEVGHLGIHVTNVEPGPFRTDWAGRSATYTLPATEDYDASAVKQLQFLQKISGSQKGSPEKAAEAIFALTRLEKPPVQIPLGAFAYGRMRQKAAEMLAEIDAFEHIGLPTDFEE